MDLHQNRKYNLKRKKRIYVDLKWSRSKLIVSLFTFSSKNTLPIREGEAAAKNAKLVPLFTFSSSGMSTNINFFPPNIASNGTTALTVTCIVR